MRYVFFINLLTMKIINKLIYIIFVIILISNGNDVFSQRTDSILQPSKIYSALGDKSKQSDRELAQEYYRTQQFDKAIVLYQELYKNSKSELDYQYLLYSLIANGDYEDALKLVNTLDKSNLRRYIDQGYIYQIMGNRKKAEKLYQEGLDKMLYTEQHVRKVASLFRSIRENEYVVYTYEEGRKRLNNPNLFSLELGSFYYSIQNYPAMVEEYLRAAENIPGQENYVLGRFQYYLSGDTDGKIAEALREEFLYRAQQEKEGTYYAEKARWFYIQLKDFEFAYNQTVAIEKKGDFDGYLMLDLASICMQNKDYNTALKCFEFITKNYKDTPIELSGNIGLLEVKYNLYVISNSNNIDEAKKLDKMFTSLIDEVGVSNETLNLILTHATLKSFYLKDYDTSIDILNSLLDNYNWNKKEIANIKLLLADIYVLEDDLWEATLLYSQVEKLLKDDVLGQEAKFRNAKLFYYLGEFNWAYTKLDILKTSTNNLIANDAMRLSLFIKDNMTEDTVMTSLRYFAKAELAEFRKDYNTSFIYLDSANNSTFYGIIEDDVLYKKAQINFKLNKFEQADSLLQIIIERYPYEMLIDEALYYSAYINDYYLNNLEKAKEYYTELYMNYPSSVFAVLARNRYRDLRGDNIKEINNVNDDIIYAPQVQ